MAEKITQEMKAKKLGVSRSLYCRYVNGKAPISRAAAKNLAKRNGGDWLIYFSMTGAELDAHVTDLVAADASAA